MTGIGARWAARRRARSSVSEEDRIRCKNEAVKSREMDLLSAVPKSTDINDEDTDASKYLKSLIKVNKKNQKGGKKSRRGNRRK